MLLLVAAPVCCIQAKRTMGSEISPGPLSEAASKLGHELQGRKQGLVKGPYAPQARSGSKLAHPQLTIRRAKRAAQLLGCHRGNTAAAAPTCRAAIMN